MRQLLVAMMSVFTLVSLVHAEGGLITLKSAHNIKQTVDRLEAALKEKGMTIFIRLDHAANANKVNLKLRPTELVVFGNPKVGTALMQCSQSAAIDLPMKMLVWEDAESQVWLTYNDPHYMADRHAIKTCDEVLFKMEGALSKLAVAVTKP